MKLASTLLSASLISAGTFAQAQPVTIEVTGITEARGFILVSAFDKAETWLKRPVQFVRAEAKAGTVSLTMADLPEGDYAFSAIHDLNANNRLDSNAIGIPTEPYGFSNDAAGSFGPPKFEDARVNVGKGIAKLTLKLN